MSWPKKLALIPHQRRLRRVRSLALCQRRRRANQRPIAPQSRRLDRFPTGRAWPKIWAPRHRPSFRLGDPTASIRPDRSHGARSQLVRRHRRFLIHPAKKSRTQSPQGPSRRALGPVATTLPTLVRRAAMTSAGKAPNRAAIVAIVRRAAGMVVRVTKAARDPEVVRAKKGVPVQKDLGQKVAAKSPVARPRRLAAPPMRSVQNAIPSSRTNSSWKKSISRST